LTSNKFYSRIAKRYSELREPDFHNETTIKNVKRWTFGVWWWWKKPLGNATHLLKWDVTIASIVSIIIIIGCSYCANMHLAIYARLMGAEKIMNLHRKRSAKTDICLFPLLCFHRRVLVSIAGSDYVPSFVKIVW